MELKSHAQAKFTEEKKLNDHCDELLRDVEEIHGYKVV